MAAKKYSPRLTPIASAVHAILVGASVASGGSVTVRSAHAALVGLCATATEAAAEEARSRGARWSPTTSKPADLGIIPSQALPITSFAGHGSLTLAYEAELAEEKAAEGGAETGFIVLDPITFEGQATGDAGYASGVASTATRLPETILDTPRAVNVVPQSVIEDRAILDPQEAIQNVSGVQRGLSRTGSGETYTVRGFKQQALFKDGFRAGQSSAGSPFTFEGPTDVANLERIEVLKGPSALLYGRGEPGGTGQASLEQVAGPVGEALIMTAVGLGVAIPAVLAYNGFVRANRVLLAQLDALAHDLHAFLTTGARVDPGVGRIETEPTDNAKVVHVAGGKA